MPSRRDDQTACSSGSEQIAVSQETQDECQTTDQARPLEAVVRAHTNWSWVVVNEIEQA